jgi:hypothetical protein
MKLRIEAEAESEVEDAAIKKSLFRFSEASSMVARGRVQNGVVVLDAGVHLPEGQEVTVLTTPPVQGSPPHSLLDIPPVSLGRVISPRVVDNDRFGEMLEGRP